jgi:hypothetical protein
MSNTDNKNLLWGSMVYLSNHMWNDENSQPKPYLPKDWEFCENINTDIKVWDQIMPFIAKKQCGKVLFL